MNATKAKRVVAVVTYRKRCPHRADDAPPRRDFCPDCGPDPFVEKAKRFLGERRALAWLRGQMVMLASQVEYLLAAEVFEGDEDGEFLDDVPIPVVKVRPTSGWQKVFGFNRQKKRKKQKVKQ